MTKDKDVCSVLYAFSPISLEEMEGVRLMNRVDTKYVTTRSRLMLLLEMLKEDYYIQEIGGNRIASYKTIYLDTEDCRMYLDHHNGRKTREKIRMREYVDSNLYFLEVKNKNNHGRTKKKRIEIGDFEEYTHDESGLFLHKYALFDPKELEPQLENEFHRITLVNRGKTERLTIDLDVHFYNEITDVKSDLDEVVIIELKQDGSVPSPVRNYLQLLRIHPGSFSKYCIGSALTNNHLKSNRFKLRLKQIDKLIQQNYVSIN